MRRLSANPSQESREAGREGIVGKREREREEQEPARKTQLARHQATLSIQAVGQTTRPPRLRLTGGHALHEVPSHQNENHLGTPWFSFWWLGLVLGKR